MKTERILGFGTSEQLLGFGAYDKRSSGHTFRNKLVTRSDLNQVSRLTTLFHLERSLRYFEKRIAEYEKAINTANYFINNVKSKNEIFDEIEVMYWRRAFDPKTRHSRNIFLSLDPVFEALRDKFSSLEIGE